MTAGGLVEHLQCSLRFLFTLGCLCWVAPSFAANSRRGNRQDTARHTMAYHGSPRYTMAHHGVSWYGKKTILPRSNAHAQPSHRQATVYHGEAYGAPPYTMASHRHAALYHDTPCDGVAQTTSPKERGVREQQKTRQRSAGAEETETNMMRAPRPRIVDPVEVKVTSTHLTIYNFLKNKNREDHFCNSSPLTFFDEH